MKLRFIIIQIILLSVFAGCTPTEKTNNNNLNTEYLRSKIVQSFVKLKEKIIQTGSPTEGPLLMRIAQNVDEKTVDIIEKINNSANISETEISDLIKETNYTYGSLGVDSIFIMNAYNEFEETSDKEDLILSLLLFDLDVHHSTWNYYNSFYYDFNYVKPIAVAKNYKIKKGDLFNGRAVLKADQVGSKTFYEIDDPQIDEGFIELPSNMSSDYEGIIRIRGQEIGKHEVKLRAKIIHNGEEVILENEFEIEVVD